MVLLPAVLSQAEPTEERGAPEHSSHSPHREALLGAGLLHAPHGDLAGSVSLRGGVVDVAAGPLGPEPRHDRRAEASDDIRPPRPHVGSEANPLLPLRRPHHPFGPGSELRTEPPDPGAAGAAGGWRAAPSRIPRPPPPPRANPGPPPPRVAAVGGRRAAGLGAVRRAPPRALPGAPAVDHGEVGAAPLGADPDPSQAPD